MKCWQKWTVGLIALFCSSYCELVRQVDKHAIIYYILKWMNNTIYSWYCSTNTHIHTYRKNTSEEQLQSTCSKLYFRIQSEINITLALSISFLYNVILIKYSCYLWLYFSKNTVNYFIIAWLLFWRYRYIDMRLPINIL